MADYNLGFVFFSNCENKFHIYVKKKYIKMFTEVGGILANKYKL